MALSDIQREGDNESRLRKERLASSRNPDDDSEGSSSSSDMDEELGGAAASVPSKTGRDPGLIEKLRRRASGLPARYINTNQGLQANTGQDKDPGLIEKLRRRASGLPAHNIGTNPGSSGNGEKRDNPGPIEKLRRRASGLPANKIDSNQGSSKKISPADGLSPEAIQRGLGRGCIMSLWGSLWPTFGHAIYLICILFFAGWASKYVRKYVPAVGEEWLPSEMLGKIPKSMLLPMKLAELVGILFILLWTLMLDLACLGLLALIVALISTAANIVS